MQIHFALSMHNVFLHFSYPWIGNCSMDSANEYFTYPWTVNCSIHVQLDEISRSEEFHFGGSYAKK